MIKHNSLNVSGKTEGVGKIWDLTHHVDSGAFN